MDIVITLDNLSNKSVTVTIQKYYEGATLGSPHSTAYVNSKKGRDELSKAISGDTLNAVLLVWGSEYTVDENQDLPGR